MQILYLVNLVVLHQFDATNPENRYRNLLNLKKKRGLHLFKRITREERRDRRMIPEKPKGLQATP